MARFVAVAAYDKSMLAMVLRAARERVSIIQAVLQHKSSATTVSNRHTLRGTRAPLNDVFGPEVSWVSAGKGQSRPTTNGKPEEPKVSCLCRSWMESRIVCCADALLDHVQEYT